MALEDVSLFSDEPGGILSAKPNGGLITGKAKRKISIGKSLRDFNRLFSTASRTKKNVVKIKKFVFKSKVKKIRPKRRKSKFMEELDESFPTTKKRKQFRETFPLETEKFSRLERETILP